MDADKLKAIQELNDYYDDYDKDFPEWYRKERERARELYLKFEESNAPVGKYGKDFDLTAYNPYLAPTHKPVKNLALLEEIKKTRLQSVGQRLDEEERTGSHLQEDTTSTYLNFTKIAEQTLFPKYPDGLIVANFDDSVKEYPWMQKYVNRIIPVNLDKCTAWNAAYSIGGVLVWVKEGVRVDWPLQACFYMETRGLAQLVHILIVAEPYSKIHLISGCALHPTCDNALHGCITEVFVGKGAEVTLSMIHNFRPRFNVRPKIGAIVDENGSYMENFVLTSEVESTQMYPTVILRGKGAKASMRSLMFGLGKSDSDMGSAIIFANENTSGEIISRSVVMDEANVKTRGSLKAYRSNVKGHLECRALLLSDKAETSAYPNLISKVSDAQLTHEAAVGKIAEEQLLYLMSRGLSREAASSLITRGFLDADIPGLPPLLQAEIKRIVSSTANEVM